MIIDMHFHLDERMMPVGVLADKMDETGVNRVVLMAQMVDPFPEPGEALVRMVQFILKRRSTRGLSRRILSNFTPDGDIKLPAGTFRVYGNPDNEKVFSVVEKYPDRFYGWVFVNPSGGNDPVEEYKKWSKCRGFAGVKAHPFWHRFNPAELKDVAGLAADDGKPLLLHAGFGDIGDYTALKRVIPELKLILAHAGFPEYSDTWRKIRRDEKIMIDFSAHHYVSESTVRDAVKYLGAERCLFGTDGPFGRKGPDGIMDYGYIKKRIERIFPDKGVQRRILGENFVEFASLNIS